MAILTLLIVLIFGHRGRVGNGTIGGCVQFVYGIGHNFRVAIEMRLSEGDGGSLLLRPCSPEVSGCYQMPAIVVDNAGRIRLGGHPRWQQADNSLHPIFADRPL